MQRPTADANNTGPMPPPVSAPRLTIGVMGSAGGSLDPAAIVLSQELGRAIAEAGCVLINGACPGLPAYAARGAKELGGFTIGISPALCREEHEHKYHAPTQDLDVIIYTGSGLMGREVTNIRSSDMVVFVGGRSGTLGEFAIAYDEGRLIGILEGTGGISAEIPAIIRLCNKDSGARVLYDADPRALVQRLIGEFRANPDRYPACFPERRLAEG